MIWQDNGLDNLYQIIANYTYGSIQTLIVDGQPTRTTERTYNRFHLMTQEKTRQNGRVHLAETTYHLLDTKLFSDQAPYFQLPKEVKRTWYLESDLNQIRIETDTTEYDIHGNVTFCLLADGTSQVSTYYSPEGEVLAGEYFYCPPDPEGFVRSLKTKTSYPAASMYGDAPSLQCQFSYSTLPSIQTGFPESLVLETERLMQVTVDKNSKGQSTELLTPLQQIDRSYYVNPADGVTHGRLKRQSTHLQECSRFIDFDYQEINGPMGQRVLQTQQTLTSNIDDTSRTVLLQSSLISSEPLLERDANGVEAIYGYDSLGRVTSETIASGTADEATRRYEYYLAVAEGLSSEQITTDVMGVKIRARFDGLNRMIYQERQDTDNTLRAGEYRQTYSARYDSLGNQTEETYFDWIDDTQSLKLTTNFQYDDWNQLTCTTGANSVRSYEVNDPIGSQNTEGKREPTVTQWQQAPDNPELQQGLTVTRLNLMGKPLQIERFDLQNKRVSLYEFRYDGAGNCRQEIDELGRITHYSYDAWSRLKTNTLPDQTRVFHTYAPHSSEALPTLLEVEYESNSRVAVGSQIFDGLGRVTGVQVGPRIEKRFYLEGQTQVCKRETPNKKTISYTYNLNLTDSPTHTIAEETTTFDYDSTSALLTRATTPDSSREYIYNKAQQLQEEIWNDASGNTVRIRYDNTLLGRQNSRTETIDGTETTTAYKYDAAGRLDRIAQGALRAQFVYDTLGRLQCTTTQDTTAGHVLVTALEYDFQDHEVKRTLTLNDQPPRVITQTWAINGLLETRTLEHDGKNLLAERFFYDVRGRLSEHYCEGETLPTDNYGQAIVGQIFLFDGLDNITERLTLFADGSDDSAVFTYQPNDACQLLSVSHTHQRYIDDGRELCLFTFDADGNQLNDESGNRLAYDSQGRLLNVCAASSGAIASRYRYDGHNQLVASQQGEDSELLRMYEGNHLVGTLQDKVYTRFFHDGDQALGQQQSDKVDQPLLCMTDANRSVIAQSQQHDVHTAVYNAYGESGDWSLRGLLAFNGEAREPGNGWYLLGKGYRAYNPSLMRFHSPDSLSPFGAGGVNPYVYCLGNPIQFRDPTGHSSWSQEMTKNSPIWKRVEPIEGFNLLSGLMTAAMVGLGVGLAIFTGGSSMVIAVGLAIDLVATAFTTAALYTRGIAKKNLDLIGTFVGFGSMPIGGEEARKSPVKKQGEP